MHLNLSILSWISWTTYTQQSTPWEQCFKANNDIFSCLCIQICFCTLITFKNLSCIELSSMKDGQMIDSCILTYLKDLCKHLFNLKSYNYQPPNIIDKTCNNLQCMHFTWWKFIAPLIMKKFYCIITISYFLRRIIKTIASMILIFCKTYRKLCVGGVLFTDTQTSF